MLEVGPAACITHDAPTSAKPTSRLSTYQIHLESDQLTQFEQWFGAWHFTKDDLGESVPTAPTSGGQPERESFPVECDSCKVSVKTWPYLMTVPENHAGFKACLAIGLSLPARPEMSLSKTFGIKTNLIPWRRAESWPLVLICDSDGCGAFCNLHMHHLEWQFIIQVFKQVCYHCTYTFNSLNFP